MVADLGSLTERSFPYLGFYVGGGISRQGNFPRFYTWVCSEDLDDPGTFRVSVQRGADWLQAKEKGRLLAKGKVFLGTWSDGEEYLVTLPLEEKTLPTKEIGAAILKGLYRLHESPYPQGQTEIDFEAAATELRVSRELFLRAYQRQVDDGFITSYKNFIENWPIANCWLSSQGASYVEDHLLGVTDNEGRDVVASTDRVSQASDPASVAVVHGRDQRLRGVIFTFLRNLGLHPIEWEQAIKRTGEASPFIGNVVDALFRDVQAVVVLLTGDDLAQLRQEFRKTGDNEDEPRPQPRPNVLFEAGIVFGRMPERTILVQVGQIREISDLTGRHVIVLNSPADRHALANRLVTAGCPVDRTGTDWLTHGNFGPVRRSTRS